MTPVQQYIVARCQPDESSGCWLWTNSLGGPGYGNACWRGAAQSAARLSYLAFKGELGPGQQVEHSCDVRACVAPHHLRAGTAKSNNEDKARKGRAAKKLTAEQVVEIRARCAAGEFQYVVARDYGVTQRAVWNVVHRLHWGHVP